MTDSLEQLQSSLRSLRSREGWEDVHTPRNLAMAVSWEAAELLQEFAWQLNDEPLADDKKDAVASEMADVLIFLIHLADVTGIDLLSSTWRKHRLGGSSGGGLELPSIVDS